MYQTSIPPEKPQEPPSFSVLLLILGCLSVFLSTAIPYMYHESNNQWPPYLGGYVLWFVVGVVLIGVNAKYIHEEKKKHKQ